MKNRQIKLVRTLTPTQLKQAIDNYCNGITLARLIAGECLNADAINEFRKIHVKPYHTAQRIICKNAPTPVKYPQNFEDDETIPEARTRISAINQYANLYGCAAAMCSEK